MSFSTNASHSNHVKSITFKNGLCSGGHGLSIGSVGGRSDNTVSGVTFSNSQVTKSDNGKLSLPFSSISQKRRLRLLYAGIRIKASVGDTGTITGVTYSGITLSSINKYVPLPKPFPTTTSTNHKTRYGILIEQNYDGGDLKGSATSGIPITKLTLSNISGAGAVSSSGYDVVITCGSGACSGWTWSGVNVTGGKKYGSCTNVPSGLACS